VSCDHIRQLISESYDRRLTAIERLQISEHLQTCQSCARFDRALRAGVEGVVHLPDVTPSPWLRDRVHTEAAMRPRMTPGRIAQQAAGMLGAAAVVALLAVVTIFLLNNHIGTSPDKTPQIAAGTNPTSTTMPTTPGAVTRSFAPMSASPQAATTATAAAGSGTATAESSTPIAQSAPQTPTAKLTATSSPSPIATTPVVDEKTAEEVVVGYFHAINVQDYTTAYGYLGSVMQQDQSLKSFVSGFQSTKHDTLTITSSKADDSGVMIVNIYLEAEQTDGSIRHYHGSYVVGYEDGAPRIVDATVVEDVDSTATPTATRAPAACVASSLSAKAGYQGATGSMAGAIIFTNSGADQCTLQGTADVTLVDANGDKLPINQKMVNLDGSEQPVTLDPGGQASLFFVWSNWCPAGTTETSSAGPIAGGLSIVVTLHDSRGSLTVPVVSAGSAIDVLPPRCDVPGRDSTISVGTFKTFPDS